MENKKQNKLTITAHCLVKNEAKYVWYAVMSIIDHVDRVLLWDTGSTDETLEIINEILMTPIGKKKVHFKQIEKIDQQSFTRVRQEMLDVTTTDWILMVDGDEIWWDSSIKKVVEVIQHRGGDIESIVVPTINVVGDIYHYQEEAAGNYELAGKRGHLNLRGINRRIPGLKSLGPHGQWGWADSKGRMIEKRNNRNILFVDAPYIHTTHLQRSGNIKLESDVPKRKMKLKYEIGIPFAGDFFYPEVFFKERPAVVPSPWVKMSSKFRIRATLETPLKKIKRRLFKSRVGY